MPYIDKNGKPILWEEVNYANNLKKALIYYPVKAKSAVGPVPSPSVTPSITPTASITPSITPTASITPTPSITPTVTPSITITPTPTPSSSTISFDPDAAAYLSDVITSGGTVNATMSAATDTLFTSLKSAGLYTKMAAMYPFVGGTAASHAINALLNKSFDITWNGGMVHSISGSTGNGTNAYGNTNFSTGDFVTTAQAAFGFYTNAADVGINGVNGAFYGGNRGIQVATNYNNNWGYRHGVGGFQQTANGGSNTGQFITVRTGTTEAQLYRNTVNIDTYTSVNQLSAPDPMLIFNMWSSTAPGTFYSQERMSFVFFANNLLYSEVSTLDNIINTFQTSLGRNTY